LGTTVVVRPVVGVFDVTDVEPPVVGMTLSVRVFAGLAGVAAAGVRVVAPDDRAA